ncbi:hypothetical protein WJX77_010289 [Trebouxia sp. C0004]
MRRLVPHLKYRTKLTRIQSTSAGTQTVTRFSRSDAESVHKSLETLTQAILKDPVTRYLSPGDEVSSDDLKQHIQQQLDQAHAADLLFHVDDFAAAAWCYKVPEELVRRKQQQHVANLHVHFNLLNSLPSGAVLKNVVSLQPLKEVNQEPAAMSDSTVKDKFTELDKALSEQLVDFLMAHGSCIKVSFIGTQPEKQGQGLGGQLIRAINKVADAEQQWVYLEASTERGTHLYLRNGFQVVKQAKMQPDAPTIYCMGRPPKPDVPSDV